MVFWLSFSAHPKLKSWLSTRGTHHCAPSAPPRGGFFFEVSVWGLQWGTVKSEEEEG